MTALSTPCSPAHPDAAHPATPTQPSAAAAAPASRPRRPSSRRALPAFLVACVSVAAGGLLLGVGGSTGRSAAPAAEASLVARSSAVAAARMADGLERERRTEPVAPAPSAGAERADAASPGPRAAADSAATSRGSSSAARASGSEPRPAPPEPDPDAPLRVKRLVLARDVEAREPVDPSERFELDEAGRIYAFVEVENPERAESEILVTFEPAGGPSTGHVRLRVGPSSRWRTWAFTRGARTAGAWEAVVRNASGEVLARAPFAIES